MGPERNRCVAIMGATATGKSAAAVALAGKFGGEVISMDSRQVYRGMDIGTGKISASDQQGILHHLIDIIDPTERSSAGRHATLTQSAARAVESRGHLPILAGGTGLYFRAFFDGLIDVTIPPDELAGIRSTFAQRETAELYMELRLQDAERASEIARTDRIRITRALELIAWTGDTVSALYAAQRGKGSDCRVFRAVLTMPRILLRGRIATRTREMFAAGWPAEVRRLLEAGVPADAPGMNSLGYAEIAAAIRDGREPSEVLDAVITATQQYAKRQETFFRREGDARVVDVSEEGWMERLTDMAGEFLASE